MASIPCIALIELCLWLQVVVDSPTHHSEQKAFKYKILYLTHKFFINVLLRFPCSQSKRYSIKVAIESRSDSHDDSFVDSFVDKD